MNLSRVSPSTEMLIELANSGRRIPLAAHEKCILERFREQIVGVAPVGSDVILASSLPNGSNFCWEFESKEKAEQFAEAARALLRSRS